MDFAFSYCLVLLLALPLAFSSPSSTLSTNLSDVNSNPPTKTPINFHLLAVQWPKSYCSSIDVPAGAPCDGSLARFTIHGLWPEGGENSSISFNPALLKPIEQDLIKKWPNLRNRRYHGHDEFWGYQWNKHGVMSDMGIFKYFDKTVELYKNLPITRSIGSLNSGLAYSMNTLQIELQKLFHMQVIVKCGIDRNDPNVQLLQEIRFNFSTTFVMQPTRFKGSSCDLTQDILFP